MSGSSPEPEAVTSSAGTSAAVLPGLARSSASRRRLTVSASFLEVGPRFDAPEAPAS
jgi:hypothetical protein